jgi:hypothetical protein
MKSIAFAVSTVLLLTACASVPRPVQILEVCPRVPTLELQIESDALEHNFLDRIATFLSGRLPEPISYELPSDSVKLPTIK